jgi:alpha-1,6-mannosyltransferase
LDNNLKICDLTQSYTPTSGGIRTYIDEKSKHISQWSNFEHVLVIPGKEDTMTKRGATTRYTIKAALVPHAEPYRFTFRMDRVLYILQKEKPDIIELGSGYVMPFAAFIYKLFHPSCILSGFYHTDYPGAYVYPYLEKRFPGWVAKIGLMLAQRYARFIYNRCNITFAPSAPIKQKLLNMKVKNVRKVSLGVDIDLFNPRKRDDRWREVLGLSGTDKLLIYAGRFDSEKRIKVLLDAFAAISQQFNGKFALIGEGPLKSLIQSYSQSNPRIVLLPYETSKERLAVILASADIYVTAGPHETFGLSILEAQSCGLPVVGVAAGALLERVDSSVGCLVPVDSVVDFSRAILQVSHHGCVSKGRAARERIESEFSWKTSFEKLMQYYEKFSYKAKKRQWAFEPTLARF